MQGASAFGRSVVLGVTGLVTQPISGASEGGMGVVKGMMKGLTGVIVKPAVGAVDFITYTNEGLKNTTREVRKRVRYPRVVGPDKVIRVYNAVQAKGQFLLWNANDGQHRNEYYVSHAAVMGGNVVIGSQSIMFVLEDERTTKWTFRTSMVREVTRERPQLVLRLVEPMRDSALGQAYDSRILQPRSNEMYDYVYSQIQLGLSHRPATPLAQ
jgi:vacuolar protein sorting-associated protein 13A/C